jgi:hypothetical protein
MGASVSARSLLTPDYAVLTWLFAVTFQSIDGVSMSAQAKRIYKTNFRLRHGSHDKVMRARLCFPFTLGTAICSMLSVILMSLSGAEIS